MAVDERASEDNPADDMLPDEQEAIAERLAELEDADDETVLSPDEVAEQLGLSLK